MHIAFAKLKLEATIYVFFSPTSLVIGINYKCLHLSTKIFPFLMLFSQVVDIGCLKKKFNSTQFYEL